MTSDVDVAQCWVSTKTKDITLDITLQVMSYDVMLLSQCRHGACEFEWRNVLTSLTPQ